MTVHWPKLFWQHYQRAFGKPYDWQDYEQDQFSTPIRLVTYDRAYREYRVFASVGLTEYSDELQQRGEVIVLADAAPKDVPFLMVNALFFMIGKRIPLASKYCIGGVDVLLPRFAEQFGKSALYFTDATGFPEGFERVEAGGESAGVFQGIFVSPQELAFIQRHGGAEFEAKLEEGDADPCSLRRPSVV
jgi:hypothetical protein